MRPESLISIFVKTSNRFFALAAALCLLAVLLPSAVLQVQVPVLSDVACKYQVNTELAFLSPVMAAFLNGCRSKLSPLTQSDPLETNPIMGRPFRSDSEMHFRIDDWFASNKTVRLPEPRLFPAGKIIESLSPQVVTADPMRSVR